MPPVSIKKPQESLSPAFVSARVEALASKSPGVVLAAAGDVLRRSVRAGREVVEQAERALQNLGVAEVTAAVAAIDVASCRSSVEQAGAQAFEAAFADTAEERGTYARAAVDALLERDAVESTVFAAKRRAQMEAASDKASLAGGPGALPAILSVVEEKTAALRVLDGLFTQSVGRELTGINEERRGLLRELDPALHDQSPWFTRFGGVDDMLPVLAGTKTSDISEGAAEALRASALPPFVSGKTAVDAEASALGRVAMGSASAAERAFLDARAKRDEGLALGLRELEAPMDSGDA